MWRFACEEADCKNYACERDGRNNETQPAMFGLITKRLSDHGKDYENANDSPSPKHRERRDLTPK
jgi:hypothetical protein